MVQKYRTYSGYGNNLANPKWGAALEPLLRLTKPSYADKKSKPSGGDRPNPRNISNLVCVSTQPPRPPHASLTNFMWAWGQFVDHEIDLTLANTGDKSMTFKTPPNDPDSQNATVPFTRSAFDETTGVKNPRQQLNFLSSYVDASNVYGASCDRALALRAFDGTGKLKCQSSPHGPLLPVNSEGLDNDQGPLRKNARPDKFFVGGDIRVNEHNVLTCMHTLFLREHNRLCDELARSRDRSLRQEIEVLGVDEAIYQRARRIVGAIEQIITYEEFLPALLGPRAIPDYKGYKPKVNASVANVFSTVCYRLGHSMLNDKLLLVSRQGTTKRLRLDRAFWRPERIRKNGIDLFLNGLWQQHMEQMDTQAVEAVRTFLFNVHPPRRPTPEPMLMDLAALNIQRGRDHGLPNYNTCRANFKLKRKKRFQDISSDPETVRRLERAYKSVNRIDPWVGGLAEDAHKKSVLGEFFFTVVRDQFIRLRDGDRFWYENDPAFSRRDIAELKKTTLSQVIHRNTQITDLPDNVFVRCDEP